VLVETGTSSGGTHSGRLTKMTGEVGVDAEQGFPPAPDSGVAAEVTAAIQLQVARDQLDLGVADREEGIEVVAAEASAARYCCSTFSCDIASTSIALRPAGRRPHASEESWRQVFLDRNEAFEAAGLKE
jgi:hypothetical protein